MGVLAGTTYGLWAVYANWNHDFVHVARAASVQFLLSFCATSFLTLMIELVLARGRSVANRVLAAMGPHAAMTVLFLAIHRISGTPDVVKTIAPSVSIGLVFAILYVLRRSQAPQDAAAPAGVRHAGDSPAHEVTSTP
ncbi:MAG TPA: hypothetical protein VFT22_26490 [Kofleriaceae bacterium]|nr:hypothetical protein [Kofleriaceae bacterium]